jgi:hypothetical protein
MLVCYNTLAETPVTKRTTIRSALMAMICCLGIAAGCAKTDDGPPQANSSSTKPSGNPQSSDMNSPAALASGLVIDNIQQWFPPARLRLTSKDGQVIARLYSDDPNGVWTGKQTVNSYDMVMALPNISDPNNISQAVWHSPSSSMEKQDTPYGIFLDNQHEILQPMYVTVAFHGNAPRVKVEIEGKFAQFKIVDQMPNPAPTIVDVKGELDATVMGH